MWTYIRFRNNVNISNKLSNYKNSVLILLCNKNIINTSLICENYQECSSYSIQNNIIHENSICFIGAYSCLNEININNNLNSIRLRCDGKYWCDSVINSINIKYYAKLAVANEDLDLGLINGNILL